MSEVFDNYVNACNYPGKIDSNSVEKSLKNYLESLGIKKKIKQTNIEKYGTSYGFQK